mmetsp:Transcript_62087/g.103088  ORF Transcript_62087/g.103088 Transcript_62087/m.103088 type:complete len:87 (-) Transcript_62087:26-286(-)
MVNVAIAGMAVTYIRSTGEHVPTTIIGASTRGDDFFQVKYMRNEHELEHHAPLDCVTIYIDAKGVKWVTVRVRGRYILLALRCVQA